MAPNDPSAGGNPVPLDREASLRLFRAAYDGRL
jgi:hypothetical protein